LSGQTETSYLKERIKEAHKREFYISVFGFVGVALIVFSWVLTESQFKSPIRIFGFSMMIISMVGAYYYSRKKKEYMRQLKQRAASQ